MNDLGVMPPEARQDGLAERSAEIVFTNARIVTADEVLHGTVQGHVGATPYARWGNWPVIALSFAALAALALARRRS